ncbi:MAG: hypothetical protein ACHQT6_01745 [Candidatus Acidiferrales bacterium]
MATPSKVINVPKPEAGSYNPNRPAGLLLRSQAQHIREALLKHLEELAAIVAIDPNSLKTEGDVSAYVHRATAVLHRHAARPANK